MQSVQGIEAKTVLVAQTLRDLQANPYNPDNLSLGQVVYTPQATHRERISAALERLRSLIVVEAIETTFQEGDERITVRFSDREARSETRSVTVG